MVTVATSQMTNASSPSFTATTIIKKLAPSPRDGLLPNNNKWRTKQPLSPRNNINNYNRDGTSPRNNGGISSPRMALKTGRPSASNHPIITDPPLPIVERSRSPVAAASVVSSLYSGAPTMATTTPVSHVISSPRLADTTAESITLSTESKVSAVRSPLPVTINDDNNNNNNSNNNNNNVVEFSVDDLVGPPPPPPLLALPITSPKTPTGTRSKKMLVVDPKSGKKYDLKTDDHSLTDKELYVIHKSDESRMVLSPDSSCNKTPTAKNTSTKANSGYFWRSPPVTPTNNDNTNTDLPPILHFGDDIPSEAEEQATLLLHNVESIMNDATLDTASAITDVSYHGHPRSSEYGRGANGGLLRRCGATLGGLCLIDDDTEVDVLSAILADEDVQLAEKAALSATVAEVKEKEKVVEERDDVDCIPPNYMLENIVGVDDDAEELVHAMLRARTIRKRLSIDGSGSQQDDKQQNPMLSLTAWDLFSPMSNITGPLSTVMSGLAKTFSFVNVNDDSITVNGGTLHETNMSHTSSGRRVCMVVKPEELNSCLLDDEAGNAGCVGLLGMKFHQCGNDFQAHVRFIQRGSKAEKMGVKVGDRVSFAVALSNMTSDQQSERLAERLMKRLETVGMRTSYRELYDIFLSKTTNSRPIGMVFRRDRTASKAGPTSPRTATANYITNEFDWSTDFLHSLSIKCREYEFEQKAPFGKVLDLNEAGSMGHKLVLFLPRPNVDCTFSNMEVSDYLNDMLDNLAIGYHCTMSSPMMSCIDSTCVSNDVTTKPHSDFLSNRLLSMLVEQAMGLVFIRREYDENNNVTGSGFAVVRNAEGSWSAPCFLSVLGSSVKGIDESAPLADVKMIIIRNTAMVVGLNSGNAVKFSVRKNERANLLVRDATVVGIQVGRFLPLAVDFFVLVKANMELNHGAYASLSTDNVEAKDILTGTLSPPEQSVDFYGALQSLELPYSMHSHPVMPDTLQRYSDSDWVEFLSDHDGTLDASSCGMRTKLALISQRDMSADIQREIDIFARKFKYYLMDGVPVLRILSATSLGSGMEEKVLRITINDPSSLYSSSLELLRRRRPGVSNVDIPSNFSTTFEAITKLSPTPPTSLVESLDEEEKKRFFSVETDLSPGPIMMLAKTKKDAMLLLCGLKLLLEREKMASLPQSVKVGGDQSVKTGGDHCVDAFSC